MPSFHRMVKVLKFIWKSKTRTYWLPPTLTRNLTPKDRSLFKSCGKHFLGCFNWGHTELRPAIKPWWCPRARDPTQEAQSDLTYSQFMLSEMGLMLPHSQDNTWKTLLCECVCELLRYRHSSNLTSPQAYPYTSCLIKIIYTHQILHMRGIINIIHTHTHCWWKGVEGVKSEPFM